jgi:hypothetical protein
MSYPKVRKKRTKLKDCIGKIYNFLTVIKVFQKPVKSLFLCKCDCGVEKTYIATDVINGGTKSCGCKRKELFKESKKLTYETKFQFPVEKKMYSSYKSQCKIAKKDFLLSFEEFKELVNSQCFYCGEIPLKIRFIANKTKQKPLNGIDRVNNSIGYVLSNCVSCCTICNFMKKMLTKEDFLNQVDKIYKFIHND